MTALHILIKKDAKWRSWEGVAAVEKRQWGGGMGKGEGVGLSHVTTAFWSDQCHFTCMSNCNKWMLLKHIINHPTSNVDVDVDVDVAAAVGAAVAAAAVDVAVDVDVSLAF